MARPTSPLLDRRQILTGALDLLDETGSFTLPGLARRLGVSASSIYHHVPGGREEIVEGVRGLLTGQDAVDPEPGEGWRDYAGRWARGYRAAMAAHPHVVPLLTAQTVTNPLTLAWYEQLALVLREGGFGADELLHVVSVLDAFVLGSALDAAAPLDVWADPGDDGSALGEAVRATRAQPGDRSLRSFETGLRILLAGLGTLSTR